MTFRALFSALLIFTAQLSLAAGHTAKPDFFSFSQEYKNDSGENVTQTTSIFWVNEDHLSAAIEDAEKDLTEAGLPSTAAPTFAIVSKEHQNLFNSVSDRFRAKTIVDFSAADFKISSREPASEGSAVVKEGSATGFEVLEKEFDAYYAKTYRTKRITLIVSRFLVNGVVASFGFVAGGILWTHAIVLGSLTGSLSGSVQLLSHTMNRFISTNYYGIQLAKKLGFAAESEVEKSPFFKMLLKWGGIEVTFLALLKTASFALGDLGAAATLSHESLNVLLTASKSMASQGLWDTSMAKDLSPKIREAILKKDFAEAARLRFRNEISGFTSSMIWAVAAITDLSGVKIGSFAFGDMVFGGLGMAGATNHVRLMMKDSKKIFEKVIKKIPFGCERWLRSKQH